MPSDTSPLAPSAPPAPRLLRRWDLGDPQRIAPLPESGPHRAWRVETAAGVVLLKRYGAEADRRRVLFEHSVRTALDEAGLPVPAPVPARDGRTLVRADGQGHAVFPWTDGTRREGLELSLRQCHELGELLGRLHAELDRLTPPVQQSLLVPTSRAADAVAAVDGLLAALPPDGDDFAALARRRLAERRALLVELADHQPPEAEAFAVGYVHGAFDARNVLYGRTRQVAAVVGWGGLRIAPFAGDLVRAAAALFAGHGEERGLDLDRAQAFVAGHRTAFPLDAGQIYSAVHRLWWEHLCDLGPLRRHYLERRDPAGAADAALVAWWTQNLDRTLEAFAAPYTSAARADLVGHLDGP
ncbi:phosphotransferase enzyme family protein [Thermomonospora cellulosilytica]|uniref:Ser/Thr protein kinase RdoA (MazF antagonist) n=1 Tax=Thermomonospora cellulosilytica TaxID=1411118 RepID=A0A7W3N2G9_9ACTN|nr:phosphotransferase [Thermomonospora cellulosilytica]MBA9006273.1 Ser/Thr protein kinase RdoA (MazF antagonist) [Thermomonospora cellulosilytica]